MEKRYRFFLIFWIKHDIFLFFLNFIFHHQVKSKAELDRALDDYNVGETVKLKLQRGSEVIELPLALEEK